MKIASYICFAIAIFITPFALMEMVKPSVMPIASVIGSASVPGLFYWWGWILRGKAMRAGDKKEG
jgi:hypothetical protein